LVRMSATIWSTSAWPLVQGFSVRY
jgi:hypothetical protein